jgi:AraC-like DNA-binding protein
VHSDVAAPWSVETLAREVALSRSAFSSRFTARVGVPPMRYVSVWRLQTGRLHLTETQATIAAVAHRVGYESEEAFSRAFKRAFGLPPAQWRERNRRSHVTA